VDKKYGGYTLAQLSELIAASETTEQSIDEICGGDSETSCLIIKDLVAEIERCTWKVVVKTKIKS